MNEWLSISEAISLTNKSEMTIRRFVNEHKDNPDAVKKVQGKLYINAQMLDRTHSVKQMANTTDAIKEKKEAMQIAYNSEIIRQKDDYLKAKDRQIELLINKKSYMAAWLSMGFTVLIIAFSVLGWLYRSELLMTWQNDIRNKEVEIQSRDKIISEMKAELTDARAEYIKSLSRLSEIQLNYSDKLERKDQELKEERIRIEQIAERMVGSSK